MMRADLQLSGLFLCTLLFCGCVSSRQTSLTPDQEARLLEDAMSPEAAGITVTARKSGTLVRWREMVRPEMPVTMPLLSTGSSHSRQPVVAVRLNAGRPVHVVVDTGAPINLLDAQTALDNGLDLVEPDRMRNSFQGLGGAEQTYFGMVRQMTAGSELAFRNVLTAIRAQRYERRLGFLKLSSWNGNALGMSTLGNFAHLTLDYPARTATFSYREYFEEPASAVCRIPFTYENQQIRVPLRLGNREVAALMDTGNDAALMLSSNLVEELGWQALAARGRKETYVGLGGERTLRRFSVPELRLGEATFKKVAAVCGPPEFGVVLGSGFLYRYRVTVDFRRKTLWLENSSPPRMQGNIVLPIPKALN
jgi:predicted aspartyl protease